MTAVPAPAAAPIADIEQVRFDRALEESLVAIRRAGADVIVSYAARPWALR